VIPGAGEAIGAGAALLVYSLAVLFWRPARHRAAELLVVVLAVVALGLGLHPFGVSRAGLWRDVLLHPAVLTLILLALFQSRMGPGALLGPTPANAMLGGFLLGWLPAVALLAPQASGPKHAARLALLATAAAAASPIGGPVQILVAGGTGGWSWWALVPALAAAVVAWPWRDPVGPPRLDPRVGAAGGLGIAASWAFGGLVGITIAAAALLVATVGRPPPPTPGAERGLLLRDSAAAHLAGSFAQIAGIGWSGAWAIDYAMALSAGPLLVGAASAAGGLLTPPMLYAAVGERIADSLVGHPGATPYLLALPAALSPVPALLLASRAHGRGVWKPGLAIGAVQLCVAMGWILLTC
jgi:hypothetical protein